MQVSILFNRAAETGRKGSGDEGFAGGGPERGRSGRVPFAARVRDRLPRDPHGRDASQHGRARCWLVRLGDPKVHNGLYDGSRALTPGAARRERGGWLAGIREASRVLFPQEAARRQGVPSTRDARAAAFGGDDYSAP